MREKTEGIVLQSWKYGESSLIVNIYTEIFGLQGYMMHQARTHKTSKMALFQPLTLLDLVVYPHKSTQSLGKIAELRCLSIYQTIPYNYTKTTISLFLTEILSKCIKEQSPNKELFGFLKEAFLVFDDIEIDNANFHLYFLAKLPKFLGFLPANSTEMRLQFQENQLHCTQIVEVWEMIDELLRNDFLAPIDLQKQYRGVLLDTWLDFYMFNIENFMPPKSLEVIREMQR